MSQVLYLNETEEEENFKTVEDETMENENTLKVISKLQTNQVLVPKNVINLPELTFRKKKIKSNENLVQPNLKKTNSDELEKKKRKESEFISVNNNTMEPNDLDSNDKSFMLSKNRNSQNNEDNSHFKFKSDYDSLQTQLMTGFHDDDQMDLHSIMSQTRELLSSKLIKSVKSEGKKFNFKSQKSSSIWSSQVQNFKNSKENNQNMILLGRRKNSDKRQTVNVAEVQRSKVD
jgi:hypothetical protein